MDIRNRANAFKDDAKAAGRLATLEAERTKIAQVSLPTAYRNLGKTIYDAGQFRDEFPNLHEAADQLSNQIKSIVTKPPAESSGSMSDKAKALASQTTDAAKKKVLSGKLNASFRDLGKAAHEKLGNSAGDTQVIDGLIARMNELGRGIEAIGETGKLLSPKRFLIAAGGIGFMLILVCGGLAFRGDSDTGGTESRNRFRDMADGFDSNIDEADALWDSHQQEKAVQAYGEAIYGTIPLRPMYPAMGRGLERMIQYKAEHIGNDAANSDIDFAAKSNIPITLRSPQHNQLYQRLRSQYQQQTNQWLANSRKQNQNGGSERSLDDKADIVRLTDVQAGMSESQVKAILGNPHDLEVRNVPAIPQLRKPARSFAIWTYNPGTSSVMFLTFEDGRLLGGESGGYDVKSGLKVPDGMFEAR